MERQKILRMTKAIDQFIDGDRRTHALPSRTLPTSEPSPVFGSRSYVAGRSSFDASNAAEKDPVSVKAETENVVVSKARHLTDDDAIDSEDKRARDVVYSRASQLIREGLSIQGWCVTSSDFRKELIMMQHLL